MRRNVTHGILCLAVAAASLLLPGGVSAATRSRAPAYSFLEYRAETVEALALQAERNPRVRARYARHFGIPASRVARFIRENLVVSYLPTSGTYRVYYVSPGGRIYARQTYLRRGTRVLALRNGEPVLNWLCGNAMVPALPRVAVRPAREVPPQVAPVVSVPAEQVAVAPRLVSVPFEQVTVQQVVPAPPVPAPVVPVPVPGVAPVTEVVPVTPVPVTVAARRASVFPVAAMLPPISFVPGPKPEVKELPPPEIPVPGPGTPSLLCLAAAPMAWSAYRARRRQA